MSEHAVAEILGAHGALSEPTAETWRLVATGELAADDAMERLRREPEAPTANELERAKLVFTPPTAEQGRHRLEQLLALMDEESAEVTSGAPDTEAGPRRWVVGLIVAVAAVALLFVAIRPGETEPFSGAYQARFDKVPTEIRGAPSEPSEVTRLLVDGQLSVRLLPEQAVDGPVGVVVFARDSSGQARALALEPRVATEGGIQLEAPLKALGLGEGTWELVFVVGRPSTLPSAWSDVVDAAGDGSEGYELVRETVVVTSSLSER